MSVLNEARQAGLAQMRQGVMPRMGDPRSGVDQRTVPQGGLDYMDGGDEMAQYHRALMGQAPPPRPGQYGQMRPGGGQFQQWARFHRGMFGRGRAQGGRGYDPRMGGPQAAQDAFGQRPQVSPDLMRQWQADQAQNAQNGSQAASYGQPALDYMGGPQGPSGGAQGVPHPQDFWGGMKHMFGGEQGLGGGAAMARPGGPGMAQGGEPQFNMPLQRVPGPGQAGYGGGQGGPVPFAGGPQAMEGDLNSPPSGPMSLEQGWGNPSDPWGDSQDPSQSSQPYDPWQDQGPGQDSGNPDPSSPFGGAFQPYDENGGPDWAQGEIGFNDVPPDLPGFDMYGGQQGQTRGQADALAGGLSGYDPSADPMQGFNPDTNPGGNYQDPGSPAWGQGGQGSQGQGPDYNANTGGIGATDVGGIFDQRTGGAPAVGAANLDKNGFDTSQGGLNQAYDQANAAIDANFNQEREQERMNAEQDAGAMGLKNSGAQLRAYQAIDANIGARKTELKNQLVTNKLKTWEDATSALRGTEAGAYLEQNKQHLDSLSFRDQANLQIAMKSGDLEGALSQIRLSSGLSAEENSRYRKWQSGERFSDQEFKDFSGNKEFTRQLQQSKNAAIENLKSQGNELLAKKFSDLSDHAFSNLQADANRKWNTGERLSEDEIQAKLSDRNFQHQMQAVVQNSRMAQREKWTTAQAAVYTQNAQNAFTHGEALDQRGYEAFMADKNNKAMADRLAAQLGADMSKDQAGNYLKVLLTQSPAEAQSYRLQTKINNGQPLSGEEQQEYQGLQNYHHLKNLQNSGYTLDPVTEEPLLRQYESQYGGGTWGNQSLAGGMNFQRALAFSFMNGYLGTSSGENALDTLADNNGPGYWQNFQNSLSGLTGGLFGGNTRSYGAGSNSGRTPRAWPGGPPISVGSAA